MAKKNKRQPPQLVVTMIKYDLTFYSDYYFLHIKNQISGYSCLYRYIYYLTNEVSCDPITMII